jgi:hypothetical protein
MLGLRDVVWRMIKDQLIGKDVEGGGGGLIGKLYIC